MSENDVKPKWLVNKTIEVSLLKVRTSENEICLLTCFSNVNLMLGCCIFKNSKKLSASDSQLKRHTISSTNCLYNFFHILKKYSVTKFNNPWKD